MSFDEDTLAACCTAKDWTSLEQHAQKMAESINKRQYEIGSVIVDLKSFLTDTNEENRSNGMKIVSFVLIALDCDILTNAEVTCIVEFFNNRLKDRIPVIESSLSGLKALCQFSQFNFEMASSIFFTLQNEVSVQLLKPEFKAQLYRIVNFLFKRFKSDFIALGSNFVYGFLQIVDAETSPTCLVEVFELFYEVANIKKFELFKEDLFEAMACYFPIIYNKQKNDKYLDTKIHLSNLLNRAMSSTASFSEYVFQLVLDKLESESIGSKLSCYQLLESALPGYSLSQVEQFIPEMWTFIRIDTLKPTLESDELTTHALLTLSKLSAILSSNSTVCSSFVEKIWKDLEISLKSPELNLINSTIKIFIALTEGNADLFGVLFDRSHPILIQNFLFNNDPKIQALCLDALYEMLLYGRKIMFIFQSETVLRFFNLLIDHSTKDIDVNLQKRILLFINELVCVHQLENEHIVKLFNYLYNYSEQANYEHSLMYPVFDLFKNISIHNSQRILELHIEPLKKEIESFSDTESIKLQDRLLFNLTILRSVSYNLDIFNCIADFFLERLIHFIRDLNNEFFQECSANILETFEITFAAHLTNDEFVIFFHKSIMSPLISHFTHVCFEQNFPISFELIQQLSLVFCKLISVCDADTREKISSGIMRLAVEGNIANFTLDQAVHDWALLEPEKLNDSQIYFFLSLIYANYFNRTKSISSPQTWEKVFIGVKTVCFKYPTPQSLPLKLSSMTLSQIIHNFHISNASSATNLIERIFNEMKDIIRSESTSPAHKNLALNILMWTSKSLFIVKDPLFISFVQFFLDLLDEGTMTQEVLNLIDILYSNEDFHQKSSSTDSLIPSQRFSFELHQLILDRYNQSEKCEFLFIFMSYLRFIPQDIFASHISKFFLLILNGLEVTQLGNINLLSLSFIQNLLKSNYTLVQPHIVSMFRSIIVLAKDSPDLKTRKAALDCLCLIIELSSEQEELLNFKVEFLRSLHPTLGDHKRLVRKSAVKVFCKLSMLGQPGNRSKI